MPTERDDQPGRDLREQVARVLWESGNRRIGERPEDVIPMYYDEAEAVLALLADPANLDAVIEAAGMECIGAEYPWEALWDASIPERRSYYTRKSDRWYAREADR